MRYTMDDLMKSMSLPIITAFAAASATAVTMPFLMKTPSIPTAEKQPLPVVTVEKASWTCPTCSPNEKYVLKEIQKHTKIKDRNALATILGNIKQESNFIPNVCEGGSRVPYNACHRGGYGLIQWTSIGRYNALGSFCKTFGCDPSSLEGQTRYMINEEIFQRYLPEFEGRGHTISQYMVPAYYWLGWGIKGYRELYAHEYYKKLTWG